jgi:hypothetical protein
MPKRRNVSADRRPPAGASPVGAGQAHSADPTSVVTFTALSDAQRRAIRRAIRSTRDDSLVGTDWCDAIEQAGLQFSERQAEREAWLKKNLRGKKPAEEKDRVERALLSTREQQKAWANSVLDDTDLPDPGLKLREQRAEVWLYNYGSHVTPFTSQRDPIQDDLEWQLMSIWIDSGGKLEYSRKKDDPGTPYGPLIVFLARTLEAILGRTYQPSSIAKMIDRHRPEIARARGMRRRRGGRIT